MTKIKITNILNMKDITKYVESNKEEALKLIKDLLNKKSGGIKTVGDNGSIFIIPYEVVKNSIIEIT